VVLHGEVLRFYLRAKGIKEGDTVYIGEMEFEYRQ
jgi:hypothetical protein